MSEATFVCPPGSTPARIENTIWAWHIDEDVDRWIEYDRGDFVHIWDNRHFQNVSLHTTDDLINKVGMITWRFSDGSYMVRLVGEADIAANNYCPSTAGRDWERARMFPEHFKRIYRKLTNVRDVTDETHALGAFMQRVEELVK